MTDVFSQPDAKADEKDDDVLVRQIAAHYWPKDSQSSDQPSEWFTDALRAAVVNGRVLGEVDTADDYRGRLNALLARVQELEAERGMLAKAISEKHWQEWPAAQLATLAQAHRSDSDTLDEHTDGDTYGTTTDWDAVNLARQSKVEALERELARRTEEKDRPEAITTADADSPQPIRRDLARLLDNLYGLHLRPGHLDAVMDVINLHAPVKTRLEP